MTISCPAEEYNYLQFSKYFKNKTVIPIFSKVSQLFLKQTENLKVPL